MKRLLLVITLILAGCASEQAIQDRYYLLADNAAQREASLQQPLLVVKVELADHLDSDSLLYRTSETQLVYAKHNLWGQDLSEQLIRRVINGLYAKQSKYRPVETNPALLLENTRQLYIRLDKFNGAYTGVAEIAGEWYLLDKDKKIVSSHSFQIKVPLKEGGYDALINSLSQGVKQLTDSLAEKL